MGKTYYIGGVFPVSVERREGDVPMQVEHRWRGGVGVFVREEIHRMAADEYNRQGHSQTHERLVERGGLSAGEIIALLADALVRERSEHG